MSSDMQIQKSTIASDVKSILDDLYTDWPWIVAEIVYVLYHRMDKNALFLKTILSDVLVTLKEEDINSVAECSTNSEKEMLFMDAQERQLQFLGTHTKLSLPAAFSLVTKNDSFCEPEEGASTSNGFFEDEALYKKRMQLKLEQILYRDKKNLLTHRDAIVAKSESFQEEILCIDTILEAIELQHSFFKKDMYV